MKTRTTETNKTNKHKPFYYVLLALGIFLSCLTISLLIPAAVLEMDALGWAALAGIGTCWLPFIFMNLDSKGC